MPITSAMARLFAGFCQTMISHGTSSTTTISINIASVPIVNFHASGRLAMDRDGRAFTRFIVPSSFASQEMASLPAPCLCLRPDFCQVRSRRGEDRVHVGQAAHLIADGVDGAFAIRQAARFESAFSVSSINRAFWIAVAS